MEVTYHFRNKDDNISKERIIEYMKKNKRRTKTISRNLVDIFMANPELVGIEIKTKEGC